MKLTHLLKSRPFDTALTDFNSRQFKTWMKKWPFKLLPACFLMSFSVWLAIRCLKIGTFVLLKVFTYLLTVTRKETLYKSTLSHWSKVTSLSSINTILEIVCWTAFDKWSYYLENPKIKPNLTLGLISSQNHD